MSTGIDFGPLLRVSHSNVTERTFAAWVNGDVINGTRAVIAPFADTGGMLMFLSANAGNGDLRLYSNRFDVSPGQWRSTTTTITTGSWFHVAVCYNHTQTTNNPIMYINGIPQAVTEVYTPAGDLNSEVGTHVVVGNVKTATQDYTWGFDGKLYDVRIYNRFITAAEAVTLYHGGNPDPSLVTDGLVFQACAVRTGDAADYIDQDLTGKYVFENMFLSSGLVIGGTARAAP